MAGVDPTSRADYNKTHVIISEKRDKKAARYLVKDLPFPYTSKAQFERSMDTPIGAEWNTRVGFQRGTLPKVVKKVKIISRTVCIPVANRRLDGNHHHSLGEAYITSIRSHTVNYSRALSLFTQLLAFRHAHNT